MRIPEIVAAGVIAGVLAGLCSCATSSAPQGFLVDAEAEQTDTFGGWVEIGLQDNSRDAIAGELIAVQPDSVFVLTGTSPGSSLIGIANREISELTVRGYDPQTSRFATWAALGVLTTPSHGVFLAFTFPLWVIVGTASAAVQSQSADLSYPESEVAQLNVHARFPGGMPEGLARDALRSKHRE